MLDEKCDLSELCSQLMKKLDEYDIDKINVRYKLVSSSPSGVAAVECKQAKASWGVLDMDLKHEEKLGGMFGTVLGFLQRSSRSIVSCQVEVYFDVSMVAVFWQSSLSFRRSQFALVASLKSVGWQVFDRGKCYCFATAQGWINTNTKSKLKIQEEFRQLTNTYSKASEHDIYLVAFQSLYWHQKGILKQLESNYPKALKVLRTTLQH